MSLLICKEFVTDFSFHLSVLGGWLNFLCTILIYRDFHVLHLFFYIFKAAVSRSTALGSLRALFLIHDPFSLIGMFLRGHHFSLFLCQWSELHVLKSFSTQAQARLSVTWICLRHSCPRLDKNRRAAALANVSVRKRRWKGLLQGWQPRRWDLQRSTHLAFESK